LSTHRPFRFGAIFSDPPTPSSAAEVARKLEGEGFDTLLSADHYMNPVACGPLLMAAACATTTLRVGSYVYDNDFRHPAMLAKEAATIDILSNGRFELGLGAGWHKGEYDAVGLSFDPPGVRARRFEEAIEVIRPMLSGQTVSFAGAHYTLSGYAGTAMPIQHPIPLLIGGGGPRMLHLAARHADIVGLGPQSRPGGGVTTSGFARAAFDSTIAVLDDALSASGRTDGGPERNVLLFGISSSIDSITEGDRVLRFVPRELLDTSPYVLLGDVEAMVDGLLERRDRWGVTYFASWVDQIEPLIPVVRRLAATR
jgi:probable F420-dependent oxidoreductase